MRQSAIGVNLSSLLFIQNCQNR